MPAVVLDGHALAWHLQYLGSPLQLRLGLPRDSELLGLSSSPRLPQVFKTSTFYTLLRSAASLRYSLSGHSLCALT